MKNLSPDQLDKLRFEIAPMLRDAAIYAETAAQLSPDAAAKALLDCISNANVAKDHVHYLRSVIFGEPR